MVGIGIIILVERREVVGIIVGTGKRKAITKHIGLEGSFYRSVVGGPQF